MHDTSKYTVPTLEFNKMNGIKTDYVEQPKQMLAATNSANNSTGLI